MKIKNGFTLIELLGVIVLLGIIALIVVISVNSVLSASETRLSDVQIKEIEKVAEIYYLSEGMDSSNLDEEFSETCVTVNYLLENGYFDSNVVVNPSNNENIDGSVKITYSLGHYTYKYQNKSCD